MKPKSTLLMLVLLWASLIGLGATGFALNPAPGTDPPDADSPWLGKQAAQTFRFWAPEQDQGKTVHKILLNQRDAGNLTASGKTLSIAAGDMLSVRVENSEAGMVYRIRRTYPADGSFLDMVSQGGTLQFPEFSIPANGTHIMTVSANGTGDYQHSFVINVTDGKNAPVNNLFGNTGNFTENGGETISVVPELDNNVSTICNGGSVVVSIHNSILNHTYRVRQTFPSQSTWKEKTGTGGTIEFDALVIVPPSSGDAIVSVQDRSDPDGLYVSFNVSIVSQPTAPVLTKVPDVASVCTGTTVKATLSTDGSGGVTACSDNYEYRTDGGPWSQYTLNTEISTTGLSSVDIQAIRSDNTGAGCSATNMYSWTTLALPVPTINGSVSVNTCATETYTTESGMTGYTWTITGGSGSSDTESIDVTWGTTGTGTVSVNYTDGNGCTATSATSQNITISNATVLTAATLKSTLNQATWQTLAGNLGNGYDMYLYPCLDYSYLDIESATFAEEILDETRHPFYLNQTSLPANWWSYWAAKGVTASASGGWEAVMWQIINGNEPIFYMYRNGSSYQLIDGLLYQIGQGMQLLRISGDYPLGDYTYNGHLYLSTGCYSETSIGMTFHKGVANLTQQKVYSNIQNTINAAAANDIIEICAGTYNERVVINKTLTLQGSDESTCILDGTGLGNGRGILINNGITGVTIQNLTVQNFSGVSGNTDGGIYAIGGNSNLTIQHVTLKDNRGPSSSGSGFYANGPIDNVLIDHVTSTGHYPGARGIVIWNGLKSNITITNCEVYNNNCCGIELQDGTASGVLMQNNNIYNNGDNGIGVVGLQGPGENLIKGNTLSNNGRFGIEVKNPNGSGLATGAGRIVVENNTVSRTNPIGSELRDIMGIAAFRRGVLAGNVDVPTGVVIQNNTVSGYVQPSTSDGFGIVVEGTNHSVLNNNVSGCDVGIQQQAGHTPYPGDGNQDNLPDQYFGRGNSPVMCGISLSGNTYSLNGTNERTVGTYTTDGYVRNTQTGKTFCSIQAAIDDAATLTGHTIEVGAGIYNENITLSKSITVAGTGPNQTILTRTGTASANGTGVSISASGAKLQNLRVTNFNNGIAVSNTLVEVLNVESVLNANTGLELSSGTGNFTIKNSKLNQNKLGFRKGTVPDISGFTMENCEVKDNTTQGCFIAAENGTNVFSNVLIKNSDFSGNLQKGMYFEVLSEATLEGIIMSDAGVDPTYGFNNGIDINLKYGTYSNIVLKDSEITGCGVTGIATAPDNPAAIAIKARDDGSYSGNPATLTLVSIQNNIISGPQNGLRFGEFGKVNTGPSDVTLSNNDFSAAFANKALINNTNSDINAECNWWGTASGTTIASKIDNTGSGVTDYDSWITTGGDGIGTGFQPTGNCNGTTPAVTASPDHQICGESSGSIIIETMTGGVPPYTVYYGSNSLVPSEDPPFEIANITPGSYQVYITDTYGTASPKVTVTIEYLPVHNTSADTYHASIQSAIVAAADNQVIEVCAGTYSEVITVSKPLELRGPYWNESPNTGTRNPVDEAVIIPPASNPTVTNLITITASNVSILGFTIDGDNTNLTDSGEGLNGSFDAARGIWVSTNGLTGIKVEKNIVRNMLYSGVRFQQATNFFATSAGATFSYNNLINDNLIEDGSGIGVDLRQSMYAKITNNAIKNVRYGIYFHSFRINDLGNEADRIISGNTIETRQFGIWPNLFSARPYQVTNNTITAVADASRPTWYGIMKATVSTAQNFTSQLNLPKVSTPEKWVYTNNIIDAEDAHENTTTYGVWLWHVDNNRDDLGNNHFNTFTGGNISNVDVGFLLHNVDNNPATNFSGGPPATVTTTGAHANIYNIQISLNADGTGIFMKDDASWPTGNLAPLTAKRDVKLVLGSDVVINGGTDGIVLNYPVSSTPGYTSYVAIEGSALGNLALNTQTGQYIELINYSENLDATAVLFNGKTGTTADLGENLAIEDKVLHAMDASTSGLVTWVPSNVYVTTNTLGIQRGVDAASTGYIVNVAQGAFTENLNINKAVALKGANADATACGSRGPESKIAPASGLPVSVTADDVTINGFEITAPSYQNAIVCSNRSDLTISHNNIHDIGTSITNTNVHSIIYVVANAASTSNVNILDNCFNNISSSLLTGYSASAIGVLQSTSTGVLTGLNIERNTINNVNVNTSNWPTGKLAYGIIINVGSANYQTTNGKVTNAIISANEISGLSGFISTGIALEGNTENAIVQNNYVANISGNKTANREGGGYDLQGLKFETNRFIGTCTVQNNSFATDTYNHGNPNGVGYAVANYVPSTVGTAALGCNWYGTAVYNEIADNDDLTGKILNKEGCETTFVPYLVSGADYQTNEIGFQPTPGTCEGEPVVIASAIPTNIYCGGSTGSFLVSFSGGIAPYNITWTGGSANGISSPYTIASLAAGSYTITVTDTYGSSDVITAEVLYLPVTNTTASTYHPTIQAAIDAATAGDFINVCAGTYVESIVIDKGIVLRGPNYGKDPNVDDRVPEAVVEFTDWYGVYFDVANVTIDGFTFNGKGICDYGIYTYVSGAGGHLFTNNIVKNVNTMGYIGWVQTGIPSSQNIVTKNLFEDMPNARAVVTLWNYYANITNNVIQNTSVGLYAENANQPESSGLVEWKNNTISASRSGIWYNLAYGTATPLTIKDNTIAYEENTASTRWDGIWLTSLGGSINPTISGNIINGADPSTKLVSGYNLWHNTTTANDGITIQGGSVTNVDYGVWINNWDGYPTSTGSNAGRTKAKIDGLTITDADLAGLYLKDNPLNTSGASAFVYAKLTNSTISGSGTGVLIQGDDASADLVNNLATITGNQVGILVKDGADLASVIGNTITNNTHGGIVVESTAGTIGVINNNTISGNGYSVDDAHGLGLKNELTTTVDAQNNWWGDASGPYITTYNTCGLGNAVVGNVDFMPWWTTETGSPSSDLPVYNVGLGTYYCKIQDAIDDPLTLDGHEITVAAGIYQENLLVNKELIITGAGAGTTTILAGAGVAVEVTADNVTIEGFEIKHSNVTTLADMGIRLNMSNSSTIQTNKFTSNSLGLQLLDAGNNTIYQNEFAYNAIGIYFEGTTDGINFDGGSNGPFYSLSLNNVVEENNIHHNALIGGQGGQGIYLDAACEGNVFINNTISNNAAIGYYAWKASNNTLTGNMIQINGNEGIQLQGSSGNTITDNTVSGSPVGFWMRSPAENVTNNTITGNTITENVVGIKMEDDYSTNNWPGILTGNTINGNKISGNVIGLQVVDVEPGTVIDATCNWWGTENAADIAALVSENVDFLEFLVVDNTTPGNTYPWDNNNKYACGGVGPVTVYNEDPLTIGTLVSSHMTIQAAIDASSTIDGYYLEVAAGDYPEVLYLYKALDIRGPNYGINPNTGTRNDEATIKFPPSNTSWYLMYIDGDGGGSTLSDISINGFAFDGIDSYGGTYPTELIFVAGAENVSINDNILKNFESIAVRYYYQYYNGTNWVSTWPVGADISDNHISNPAFYSNGSIAPNTGIYLQGVYGSVTGNVVEGVLGGCQIQPYGHPNATSVTGTVAGNTFNASRNGLWYNNSSSATADWLFNGNTLSGIPHPSGYTPGATWYGEPTNIWYGFAINGNSFGKVSFTGNTIEKGATTSDAYGIRYVHGYAHAPKTTITGNTINDLAYGIYLPVNLANVGEILINNNSISGNSAYGVYNGTTTDVNATANWWGSLTGPTYAGNPCGTGDAISDNVLYNPWRNEDLNTDIYKLQAFTVTGNSSICVGGTANITLSGSQLGTGFNYLYDLYKDNLLVAGETKTGTGNALVWTVSTGSNATYTVKAKNDLNLCTLDMPGSATVFIGPVTTLPTLTACANSLVEVPVTVTDFNDVGSISLRLKYDKTVMSYNSFSTVTGIAFEVVSDETGTEGILTIGAMPASQINLANGATLLTLKFNFTSGTGNLQFDDSYNTYCEYGSGPPSFVAFCDEPGSHYYINGSVSCEGIAPTITTAAGSLDETLECSNTTGINDALALVPEATDICTANPTRHLISDETTPDANCPDAYVRTRTWNFSDECGNTSSNFVQVITVQDITLPIITCPTDITIDKLQDAGPYITGFASATDNCSGSGSITITFEDNRAGLTGCNGTGTILRTWTAKDACNNTSTCIQTITITDGAKPIISDCPADITQANDAGDCGAIVTWSGPTAKDNSHFQGFEHPDWYAFGSTDWNNSPASITRVASGTNGITSKTGVAHSILNTPSASGNLNYTRLGGFQNSFGSGFRTSIDIYIDLNNPLVQNATPTTGYGWDLSSAANTQAGSHLRDFIFHTAAYDATGVWVMADNNTNAARRNNIQSVSNKYKITETGWYTFEWIFRNAAGSLAVDCQVLNSSGAIVFSETRNNPGDLIATIAGGNRYMWFTYFCGGDLPLDNTNLEYFVPVTCSPASGSFFNKGTTAVTCTATDACNNVETCGFDVTVNDVEAPQLTGTLPGGNAGNLCMSAAPGAPDATAIAALYTDNCTPVTASFIDSKIIGNDCNWSATYTYSIVDENGNYAANAIVNYTGGDTEAPMLTGTPYPGTTGTNACMANAASSAPFSPENAIQGYTDNCSTTLTATLTNTEVSGNDCNWTVTYTFTVTDECGNPFTGQSYQNTGSDQTAPDWANPLFKREMPLANVNNVGANRCNVAWADSDPTAYYFGDDFKLGTSADGFWTINKVVVWGVAGLTSDPDFQLEDYFTNIQLYSATAPVDPWTSPFDYTHNQGTIPMNTVASGNFLTGSNVTDNADITFEEVTYFNNESYIGSSGQVRRIWKVTFNNLNWIVPAEQQIVYGINCAPKFPTEPAKFWYNHYSNIPLGNAGSTSFDGLFIGLDYSPGSEIYALDPVTNGYWNKGNDHNILIYGTNAGGSEINSCLSNAPSGPAGSEIAALFVDACGGTVSAVKHTETTGNDCNWNVKYSYEVTDACGNRVEPWPTVNYQGSDKTAPVLTGTWPTDITDVDDCAANVPAEPTDATIAALYTDACGGNITVTHTTTPGVANTNCIWSYAFEYTIQDACGNIVMPKPVFTISGGDATIPLITTAIGALDVTLQCSDHDEINTALTLVPEATDNCTTTPAINLVSDVTNPDASCANAYVRVRTWNFSDDCGNTSVDFVQTITVIDNTAPVITTVAGALDATLQCSDATGLNDALALVPEATDNCTTAPVINLVSDVTTPDADCDNAYVRVRTWNFSDGCGNTSDNFVQTINVIDNTAPVITTVAGALNATLQCSDATGIANAIALAPEATDNCTTSPVINLVSDVTTPDAACANAYVRVRTWNFSDGCGNTSDNFVQTITVYDNTAPTITPPADVTTVTNDGCTATGVDLGTPVVDDNCTATGDLTVTHDAPAAFQLGQTTVTWTVTDGCGNSAQATQTVTVGGHTLSGTFKYYGLNPNGTPKTSFDNLSGINVELWQNNVKVYPDPDPTANPPADPVTTDASGAYTFMNICSGTYQVVASTTKSTTGAINSTDAAQVNYWGVSPYLIQLVRFYTGDGDMNNYLESSDAARILKNFTTSGTWGWVNRGPWTFWLTGETIDDNILSSPNPPTQIDLPSITITNTSLTKDFYGMVTGDFNGSFVPSAKSYGHSLTLTHPRMRTVEKGQEILLPVTAPEALEASAVSLIMEYPSDRFEITGVFFGTDPSSDVEWAVNDNGELRLGWFALQPAMLDAGDVLLTLRVRVTGDIALDETLVFSLTQEATNEIADGRFLSNGPTELHMDALTGKSTGTHENPEQHTLNMTCFPNPFRGTTTLAYSLPADGKVTLDIASMLGTQITTLVDEAQTAGDHTLTLDASTLKPGVYTATLRLDSDGAQLVRTIRIVRSK
jgi:parallel beta-helix repeat protein